MFVAAPKVASRGMLDLVIYHGDDENVHFTKQILQKVDQADRGFGARDTRVRIVYCQIRPVTGKSRIDIGSEHRKRPAVKNGDFSGWHQLCLLSTIHPN